MAQSVKHRSSELRDWEQLDKDEQTRLLVEYGHYQDELPPSCDINIKHSRFARWLDDRGIRYE